MMGRKLVEKTSPSYVVCDFFQKIYFVYDIQVDTFDFYFCILQMSNFSSICCKETKRALAKLHTIGLVRVLIKTEY